MQGVEVWVREPEWRPLDGVPFFVWLIEARVNGMSACAVVRDDRRDLLWPVMHEVAAAAWRVR